MRYIVRRLPEHIGCMPLGGKDMQLAAPWDALDVASIAHFPWDTNGYRPASHARVGYNSLGLHVLLDSREAAIRTQVREMGGPVCTDSCMEFFLIPFPQTDRRYVNFEMTPINTLLLAIGEERHGRTPLVPPPIQGMNASSTVSNPDAYAAHTWAVSYTIPMAFLLAQYGRTLRPGDVMLGNFYKCGDLTPTPHYGCWHPIASPKPDFHRPECFGELVLEEA